MEVRQDFAKLPPDAFNDDAVRSFSYRPGQRMPGHLSVDQERWIRTDHDRNGHGNRKRAERREQARLVENQVRGRPGPGELHDVVADERHAVSMAVKERRWGVTAGRSGCWAASGSTCRRMARSSGSSGGLSHPPALLTGRMLGRRG